MDNIKITVRTDFSDTPGARYIKDGPFSGEEFYNKILLPKYETALSAKTKLEIDLDGIWGYPSSFISGSFGRLSIEKGAKQVLDTIIFISIDSETRKNRIISEIEHPTKK